MECKFCSLKLTRVRKIENYLLCTSCGTFSRLSGDTQTIMVNEKLKDELKPDKLNQAQLEIVQKRIPTIDHNLLDFGCGGGKFLLLAKGVFNKVAGIEITPESVLVAESNGITIHRSIQKKDYTVLTFWHSLEHLPFETLKRTLDEIRTSEIKYVILSVPNAKSATLKYFGDYDSFVDVENHTFIFSKNLLVKLFSEIDFNLYASPRILRYTLFGSIQSSINFATKTKNQLYFVLKRGHGYRDISYFRHFLLAPLYLTLCSIFLILAFANRKKDPVINLCFERVG